MNNNGWLQTSWHGPDRILSTCGADYFSTYAPRGYVPPIIETRGPQPPNPPPGKPRVRVPYRTAVSISEKFKVLMGRATEPAEPQKMVAADLWGDGTPDILPTPEATPADQALEREEDQYCKLLERLDHDFQSAHDGR